MERPSHTIMTLPLLSGARRFTGAGLSIIVQLGFVAVLIGGVVVRDRFKPPPAFEVAKLEAIKRDTPPPPIKLERPVMPTAVAPVVTVAPAESSGPTIATVVPQPAQNPTVATRQPPPVSPVPDSAAAGIAATHTTPPYPTLARRLGVEGKVTLRLTVLADGHVGKAEIVTSSGRQDLDQAAQQWIAGHWTYRPATANGAPVASQVLAAVQFTLTGQ